MNKNSNHLEIYYLTDSGPDDELWLNGLWSRVLCAADIFDLDLC